MRVLKLNVVLVEFLKYGFWFYSEKSLIKKFFYNLIIENFVKIRQLDQSDIQNGVENGVMSPEHVCNTD